jgi:hypothetical protein
MTMRRIAMTVLACAALSAPALARSQAYVPVTVKNRVSFELPSEWQINDAEHRDKVAKMAKERMGNIETYAASFSATSYPLPITAMLRVTIVPTPENATQEELNREIARSREGAIKEARDGFLEEMRKAPGYREKIKMRGEPRFDLGRVNGKTALVITYTRGSMVNETDTFTVTQYHVPMGMEKVMITTSEMTLKPEARKAIDRIMSTMKIK